MATVANLFIDQGTDFSATISLKNQDGTSINLTGYTVASQFRKSYQSSTSVNFTVTITSASEGKIELSLSDTATSGIRAGRYLYDVEITSPGGIRKRALEGIVVITPEITR
jgi:hypothetical protein